MDSSRQRRHQVCQALAQEIIRHARQTGVRFEWVGMDGLYGNSLELLESLQAQGETFLAEIHSDQHIYLTDPAPYLPPQGPGRPRVRYHSDVQPIEVRKWIKKQPVSRWRKKTLRKTTKGDLVVEVLHQRVWLWDKYSPTPHCWHLIVRRELNSPGTLKYSLSNAPAQTSVRKLTQMQARRFWIERAFQDAKSHVGRATRMKVRRIRAFSAAVEDEGGPLGVGVQKPASNQAVLLWSKRSW